MKVAEKDVVVQGMLEEEYQRCHEVLNSLLEKVAQYPKGSLNKRKKKYMGKEYLYHYIVSREEGRVVNRHVSEEDLPELRSQIEQRDKYNKEIKAYKKRMKYLERLLKIPKLKGDRH
ncbi:MAG: hypothetical protein JXM72_09080 [Deltaproteobacteria bacterium]|nr:hypothetical protein [Deltaproteobacteria bacterium]